MSEYYTRHGGDDNGYEQCYEESETAVLHTVDEVHSEERRYKRRQHHDYRHGRERTHHGVHVVVDDAGVGVHRRLKNVRIDVGSLACLRHLDVYVFDKVGIQLVHLKLELQFGEQRLVATD